MRKYCSLYCLQGKKAFRFLISQKRYSSKTYYEVLGVPSNSTTKEIKTAYVKLCKELHPDKSPTDANQHSKFVELNEAYSTLVRPQSRVQYDLSLSSKHIYGSQSTSNYYRSTEYEYPNYERRYGPYEHVRQSDPRSYYGYNYKHNYAEAEHRQSKMVVVLACLALMVMGVFLHYVSFMSGRTFSEKKLDEKDRIIGHNYMKVREKAIHSKNKEKVNELKNRLMVTTLNSKNSQD